MRKYDIPAALRLGQRKDIFKILSIIFKVIKSSTNPADLSSRSCCIPQQHQGLLLLQHYLQKERWPVGCVSCFTGILNLHKFNTLFSAGNEKMVVPQDEWGDTGVLRNEHASLSVWIRPGASALPPVVVGQNCLNISLALKGVHWYTSHWWLPCNWLQLTGTNELMHMFPPLQR